MQTTPGPAGDCFQACVASILELPLNQVPNFCQEDPESWWDNFRLWLVQYGLCPVCVVPPRDTWTAGTDRRKTNEYVLPMPELPNTHYILSGKSPRGHHLHAVVFFGDKMVHDPHKSGAGLDAIEDAIFFAHLHPERQVVT